jgi:hydroxymethylpyrimidine/phosphomethylpyrimidine kinase
MAGDCPGGTVTRRAGHPPVVLSIAGSDPSGGAGIQADLKTFAALDAYGCAVITSLTAQSTRGVSGVLAIPAAFVAQQLEALFADVEIDAVKIGMLADAQIAEAVSAALDAYRPPIVVLDPVMVATSGDRLMTRDAEAVLHDRLLPRADLITPNLAEAAALLGTEPARDADACRDQARALLRAGAPRVLLKGGHLRSDAGSSGGARLATDYLASEDGSIVELSEPWVDTTNTHGTGCTLSSALTVYAARSGTDRRLSNAGWADAARSAKDYLTQALRGADALQIGGGHGPVAHSAGRPGWGE